MKKSVLLITIILLAFVLTGCKFNQKEKLSNKEFIKIAKKLGYETKNIKAEQGKERGKMLKSVTSATKDDLEVQFYVFNTTRIAQTAFYSGEEMFSDIKTISYDKNVKRGKNYSHFFAETDKRYGIVSRVENTLILVDTTKKYKKDVQKLEEEMGY